MQTKQELEAMKKAAKEMEEAARAVSEGKKKQDEINAQWLAKENDILTALMNEKITHDGKEMTHWDVVKLEADKALRIEQNTYQDWRASMMGLLAIFSSLVDAGNRSLKKQWRPLVGQLHGLLREKLINPLKNYLRGPYDLTPLIHNVSMGADDKLNLGLTRADRRTEMGEMNARFKVIVDLWLAEHGYTLHEQEEGVYIKKNSAGQEEKLTAAIFNELKNSKENSLDEFLNRETSLEFKEAVEAAPAARFPSP